MPKNEFLWGQLFLCPVMSRMMNFGTERVTDAAIARRGAHPVSFGQIQGVENVLANESLFPGRAKKR